MYLCGLNGPQICNPCIELNFQNVHRSKNICHNLSGCTVFFVFNYDLLCAEDEFRMSSNRVDLHHMYIGCHKEVGLWEEGL